MRPWTERIIQLVDEGVTERETIIAKATPWVPQGHAFRVRESRNARARAKDRARGRAAGTQPKVSIYEVHRVGARHVIRTSLAGLCQCGVLTREGDHYRRAT